MAVARAAPLDRQTFAGLDEDGVPSLLEAAEEGRHGNPEGAGQRLERGQRRRRHAVLDLRQHAERQAGRGREVAARDAELVAEGPHLAPDRDF